MPEIKPVEFNCSKIILNGFAILHQNFVIFMGVSVLIFLPGVLLPIFQEDNKVTFLIVMVHYLAFNINAAVITYGTAEFIKGQSKGIFNLLTIPKSACLTILSNGFLIGFILFFLAMLFMSFSRVLGLNSALITIIALFSVCAILSAYILIYPVTINEHKNIFERFKRSEILTAGYRIKILMLLGVSPLLFIFLVIIAMASVTDGIFVLPLIKLIATAYVLNLSAIINYLIYIQLCKIKDHQASDEIVGLLND